MEFRRGNRLDNGGLTFSRLSRGTARRDHGIDEFMAGVNEAEACAMRERVRQVAAALQFLLAHPATVTVLTGARHAAEVESARELLAHPIPADFGHQRQAEGQLRADAPLPA